MSASKFVETGLEFVLAPFLVNDNRKLLLRVVDLLAQAEYDLVEEEGLQSHLLTKILQPNMAHIACDFLTKYSPDETQGLEISSRGCSFTLGNRSTKVL